MDFEVGGVEVAVGKVTQDTGIPEALSFKAASLLLTTESIPDCCTATVPTTLFPPVGGPWDTGIKGRGEGT